MEIIFATGNQHKCDELSSILKDHKILMPKDLNIQFDCEETGKTFYENALIKAKTLYNLTGKPVIADDSGLCVDALNGAPGIYSARFGKEKFGENLTSENQINLLLEKLKNQENRTARFICCIVFISTQYQIYSVQETIEGTISETKYGNRGFGYDPIFYLPQYKCTMAEISSTKKNKISHRGKATHLISKIISEILLKD